MSALKLQVIGKRLSLVESAIIIAGEINETECIFEFDSTWDNTEKTAVFYNTDTNEKAYALIKNNTCPIPWQKIANTGELYIGVFAVIGNKAWGTNTVSTIIKPGISPINANIPPAQNIYLHIIDMMGKQAVDASIAANKANEASASANGALCSKKSVDISENIIKQCEQNTKTSESNTIISETNAKLSETNAKLSETNAKLSETNAKTSETNAKTSENVVVNKTNEIKDSIAKTPYIGANGNWYQYNAVSKQYVDTLVHAQGVQGLAGGTWSSATAIPLTDSGNKFTNKNVEDALQETAINLEANSIRLITNEDNLRNLAKIAENVTPDVSVVSYSTVNTLSANAREGTMSLKLKGRTLKNELDYNRDTWAEWSKTLAIVNKTALEFTGDGIAYPVASINTKFKPLTKYAILLNVTLNTLTYNLSLSNYLTGSNVLIASSGAVGNVKAVFTTQSTISTNKLRFEMNIASSGSKVSIVDIRVFELPVGSEIETDFTTMTADQLALKYPYINGQSDVQGGRVKTFAKNYFNTKSSYEASVSMGSIPISTGIRVSNSDMSGYKRVAYKYIVQPNVNYVLSYFATEIAGPQTKKCFVSIMDGTCPPPVTGAMPLNSFNVYGAGSLSRTFTSPPSGVIWIAFFTAYETPVACTVEYTNIQLEVGSVATPYEPYMENLIYASNVGCSLPNSVIDETNVVSGEKVQKIKEITLHESDIIAIENSTINLTFAVIKKPVDALVYNNTNSQLNSVEIDGCYGDFGGNAMDISSNLNWYSSNKSPVGIVVGLTKGATLAQAQAVLVGKKLRYKLATPITTLLLPQTVKSSPNGTITWEYIKGEAGFYSSNISTSDTTLPIKNIVRLYKVNKTNGTETQLTISQAVISPDKLSFTHPGLTNGDLVDWDYEYDSALSVNPRIEYGYSNGYSGTVVIGITTLTIKGGMITNVTT